MKPVTKALHLLPLSYLQRFDNVSAIVRGQSHLSRVKVPTFDRPPAGLQQCAALRGHEESRLSETGTLQLPVLQEMYCHTHVRFAGPAVPHISGQRVVRNVSEPSNKTGSDVGVYILGSTSLAK